MFLRPVHLRFSLGWNSEQGEGTCIWAKVSLSGWKSLGLQEEKGTQSRQQVWQWRRVAIHLLTTWNSALCLRCPSIRDSSPGLRAVSHTVFNLHGLLLSVKATPSLEKEEARKPVSPEDLLCAVLFTIRERLVDIPLVTNESTEAKRNKRPRRRSQGQ